MAGFLSLEVNRSEDKVMITFIQKWLINKILIATQVEDCNVKFTPEDNATMSKDSNGDQCYED